MWYTVHNKYDCLELHLMFSRPFNISLLDGEIVGRNIILFVFVVSSKETFFERLVFVA